ncbi:MAG: S1C family serine protease [Actinomycetota bacterium]|nr:S1C family serine protease [Actinomycetota bacterium]
MTDRFPPVSTASWAPPPAPWRPSPPPPPAPSRGRDFKSRDALVTALAVIIGFLLMAGALAATIRVGSDSGDLLAGRASSGLVPGASGRTAPTVPPSSTGQPATTAPATTRPGGVAPVSPLAVPPVTPSPVTPRRPNLSPAQIAGMVNPAVVDIDTRLAFQHAIAAGTGMILTSNGVVLTNNHVIDGATAIAAVSVGTGRRYPAHVLGVDPTADVALIQLDGASGLPTVTTSTFTVAAGDPVVAIGNAGGLGGAPSVTTGTVAAINQSIIASDPAAGTSEQLDGLIETTALLQPGDSGGPLANGAGQVIGMDTAAAVANQSTTTVSFAIPIGQALAIARQIQAGQASSTIHLGLPPFLGVQVTTGAGAFGRAGALVTGVVAGGPAAAAGVTQGSVIIAINGQSIDSGPTLTAVLHQFRPGDSVTLNWIGPAGASRSARVTLGTGPAD